MEWLIKTDGDVSDSTFTADQLRNHPGIRPETSVRQPQQEEWTPAGEVPELQELFEESGSGSTGTTSATSPESQSIDFPAWESQGIPGWLKAIPSTFQSTALSPGEFYNQQHNASLNYALFYGAVMNLIVYGLSMLLTYGLNPEKINELSHEVPAVFAGNMWVFFLATWVLTPVVTVVGLLVYGGLLHSVLYVFGWKKKLYPETIKLTGFATTSTVASLVPTVGGFLGILWSLILHVTGLKKVHKLSVGKAIGTVILSFVLLIVVLAIFSFFVGFASNLVV